MGQLYERDTYTTPELYIASPIVEWDIRAAGASILFYKGLITEDKYLWLLSLPSYERSVRVGLLQRNYEHINRGLVEGFVEARQMFFESNGIEDNDVVAIKKDAIFLRNKIPSNTRYGVIEFRRKNHYTSFLMLPANVELYYLYNPMTKEERLDVKGISDKKLVLHEDGMLDIFKAVLWSAQSESVMDTIEFIRKIAERYNKRELSLNTYREFNNRSLYRTIYKLGGNRMYLDNVPPMIDENLTGLDISYNYTLLMHLYKIFTQRYYNRR